MSPTGHGMPCRFLRSGLLLVLLLAASAAGAQSFGGLTFVHDDGTLSVSGRTVHLWGIYIPLEDETCFTFLRPVQCGPRAVLMLSLKVDGFVRCETRAKRKDGSLEAQCRTNGVPFADGEDLAAYLLKNGLALARPEAPFEYHALERIARQRGIGVWGIPQRIP